MSLKDNLASSVFSKLYQSKKVAEKEIVQGFLERIGLQHVIYVITERERPDFEVAIRLENENLVFACELTDFVSDSTYYGSRERRFWRLWVNFAEKLKLHLERNGLAQYYGAVHFKTPDRTNLPAKDEILIQELVQALKQSVARHEIELSFTLNLTEYKTLDEHINHIYVRNTAPETGILWWCGHLQAGEISLANVVNGLQNSIEDKNTVASKYQWPDCKEKWLVIYAAARGIYDVAYIHNSLEEIAKIRFQSDCFDRIFLWDKWGENIYQLSPSFHVILERGETLYVKHLPEYLHSTVMKSFTL